MGETPVKMKVNRSAKASLLEDFDTRVSVKTHACTALEKIERPLQSYQVLWFNYLL